MFFTRVIIICLLFCNAVTRYLQQYNFQQPHIKNSKKINSRYSVQSKSQNKRKNNKSNNNFKHKINDQKSSEQSNQQSENQQKIYKQINQKSIYKLLKPLNFSQSSIENTKVSKKYLNQNYKNRNKKQKKNALTDFSTEVSLSDNSLYKRKKKSQNRNLNKNKSKSTTNIKRNKYFYVPEQQLIHFEEENTQKGISQNNEQVNITKQFDQLFNLQKKLEQQATKKVVKNDQQSDKQQDENEKINAKNQQSQDQEQNYDQNQNQDQDQSQDDQKQSQVQDKQNQQQQQQDNEQSQSIQDQSKNDTNVTFNKGKTLYNITYKVFVKGNNTKNKKSDPIVDTKITKQLLLKWKERIINSTKILKKNENDAKKLIFSSMNIQQLKKQVQKFKIWFDLTLGKK